jgi:hypothetical protein
MIARLKGGFVKEFGNAASVFGLFGREFQGVWRNILLRSPAGRSLPGSYLLCYALSAVEGDHGDKPDNEDGACEESSEVGYVHNGLLSVLEPPPLRGFGCSCKLRIWSPQEISVWWHVMSVSPMW